MIFDEPTLKRLYENPPVGDSWPYDNGGAYAVEAHLRETVAALTRCGLLVVEADFDHYGSGYASFVPVFCYKRNGASTRPFGKGVEMDGIVYCLCRHAPVVVWGRDSRTRHATGGSSGLPFAEMQVLPNGDWEAAHREVTLKLRQRGFAFLDKASLELPLPFTATIDTILGNPPYRVFDLLFFWND